MDTGVGRAFAGFLLGCVLLGALWTALRPKRTENGLEPISSPTLSDRMKVAPPGLERLQKAMMLAELQQSSDHVEGLLAAAGSETPEVRERGAALARAFGAAARAGWDTPECAAAEQALADWLAALRRESGTDAAEFACSPARDALIPAFLEAFGAPLDADQQRAFDALIDLEARRWESHLQARAETTPLGRIAASFALASEFESAAAVLLSPDQEAALSHRYQVRSRSRNIKPFRDRNHVLGPREPSGRALSPPGNALQLAATWGRDFLDEGRDGSRLLQVYAQEYVRQMTAVEAPADLDGSVSVPASYRAAQAREQAEIQRMMLEDKQLTDDERARLREWTRLYDFAPQ
ncbi:MAG: hypothetical protein HYY18_00820 [Planctomycetes bacterium]|nr:hypothetical protein [Planctomycetota bacterium]